MITSLTINHLRGIRHGELPGLTGLTILLGPNGCGKSTVLDALMIGSAPEPEKAVCRAINRRVETSSGLRWLFRQAQDSVPIAITVTGSVDFGTTTVTAILEGTKIAGAGIKTQIDSETQINVEFEVVSGGLRRVSDSPEGVVVASSWKARPVPDVRLIDPIEDFTIPLYEAYSDAARRGRAGLAKDVLAAVVPGFTGLEILTDDKVPVLYMNLGERPIPATLAGEGILALLRTVLELASVSTDGVALLEEPECHQHPRSLRLMAQGICESVKRGVQVVLTTHSRELVDALLYFAQETAVLNKVSVHLLRLSDGELIASRLDGDSARFQTQDIGEDLR